MRILHILDSGGIYGAESVILNLMHQHKNMGLQPGLLNFANQDEALKDVERAVGEIGLQSFRCKFDRSHPFKSAVEVFKIADTFGAHILHSHNYKGNILVSIFPQKSRKTPAVATLHGWTHTNKFQKIFLYNLIDAFLVKRLDKVVVVSEKMRRNPLLRMFRVNPTVIPNGISDLTFEHNCFEKQFPAIAERCRPNKTKLLAIGRLAPEKGYDVLIRAVSKVCSAGHNVILVVIGEGPQRNQLVSLANREGISDRVNFIGYRENAFRYIPFFDAFILSSYTEGLPITLLESMQAGVQVIATQVGEIPTVLNNGKYGRLVHPGDVNGLSNAIKELILEKDRKKINVEIARNWVKENYGVQRMANAYTKLYLKFVH